MEWFNRLGVQRKILLSNFLMVIIPVVLIVLVIGGLWALLRFTNPVSHRDWMMLAPSSIQEQALQWSLGRLNKMQAKTKTDIDDIRNVSSIMEALGVDLMIVDRGHIEYITPGAVPSDLIEAVNAQHYDYGDSSKPFMSLTASGEVAYPGNTVHRLVWDNDLLQFINNYDEGDLVIASGRVPFMAKTLGEESTEKLLVEGLFGLMLALMVLVIIGFGIYVSNRVAAYILRPLQNLQQAAIYLREGKPIGTIPIYQMDELGQTCIAFNHMQQALSDEEKRRADYELSRREMMAGICHDISTPLTSVKGFASGILDGVANTDEKRRHYAQRIYDMSGKIENLVNMLSDFSKLELGQVMYNTEIVEIGEYLRNFMAQKIEDFGDPGPAFISHIGVEKARVRIDTVQFTRVLDNIINNSWKYRDHDDLRITLESHADGDEVLIGLSDDGPGVEPEMMSRIFEVFYRTDQARTNVAMGSGIGLAIVKQIIEDFGGRIWASRPKEHRGLQINIVLPIVHRDRGAQ